MKTIGLIGGMSWESSVVYYRLINEGVRSRLGGLHSAQCLMHSVDFGEVEPLQHGGRWEEAAQQMIEAARHLQDGGADFLILCTNTMHKTADRIVQDIEIPFLHIADATADAVKQRDIKRVGLLGTRFTMEDSFYRGRLVARHGLEVVVPEADQQNTVHEIIYDELCIGRIEQESKQKYLDIIDDLVQRDVEGIILGCTEIGLLISQEDCTIPVFDTTRIHAEAAVNYALS